MKHYMDSENQAKSMSQGFANHK